MRGPRHGRREPQVRWAIGDTRGTRNLSSRAGPLRERVDGMDLVIDAHMAEEAEEARRVEVGLPCGIIAFASESPGSTSLTELIHPTGRTRAPTCADLQKLTEVGRGRAATPASNAVPSSGRCSGASSADER